MYHVSTFYHFVRLNPEQVLNVQDDFFAFAKQNQLDGLIIMGSEGVNATVSGSETCISALKNFLSNHQHFSGIKFKDSTSHKRPFKRFKIRLRDEIVTINNTNIFPGGKNGHLSPTEWNQVIEGKDDYVLLDTRNTYETKLGTFKGAIDPKIEMFGEFPDFVKNSEIPKDKKVLMFCTGGIRCEKASIAMQELGYQNVFQLDGEILKYFEEYPNRHFEGECFVFDHRVAVDQDLKPSSKYGLCPHCGNPAETHMICRNCNQPSIVCESCRQQEELQSCSKNCANHLKLKAAKQKAA